MKNEMYKDCDDRMLEKSFFLYIPLYVFSENKNNKKVEKKRIKHWCQRETKEDMGRRVHKSYLKVSDPFHQYIHQ